MEKLFIDKKASDNKYLHRHFHISADCGIIYVGEKYGDDAVIELLVQHAKSFYKLLAEDVKKNGFEPLKKYFVELFEKEEYSEHLHTELSDETLKITIDKCPAVVYMKSEGHTPSKWYKETTYTTYKILADMCNLDFEVKYYNEEDGSTEFVFKRRK